MMNEIIKDFNRDVYCLFGLPVDNLTVESTKKLLRSKTKQDGATVWATVNVNWVVQSLWNKEFRNAILNSDIVTLDGRPLLWLAKSLGYPMTEVVAGSSTIQELHEDKKTKQKLSIFLFGGENGVGQLAMEQINAHSSGLSVVGALNPGFGTVTEMSSDAIIEEINRTRPDILLVALGAKKGTVWIEHNRKQLNARIISHLGATVNFLAGTVRRAPKFFRSTGMEWVWRILQEPKLVTRYASDGLVMLHLIMGRFFWWWQFHSLQKKFDQQPPDIKIVEYVYVDKIVLSFGRNLRVISDSSVRQIFSNCVCSGKDVVLDFQKTEFVDGSFIALVLLLMKHQQKKGNEIKFVNVCSGLGKLFSFFCVDDYIKI